MTKSLLINSPTILKKNLNECDNVFRELTCAGDEKNCPEMGLKMAKILEFRN